MKMRALLLLAGVAAVCLLGSCGQSAAERWWVDLKHKNVQGPPYETYTVRVPFQVTGDGAVSARGEERMFLEPVPDPQETPRCIILAEVSGLVALEGRYEDGFFYIEKLAPVEPVEETFFGIKTRLCGFRLQPERGTFGWDTSEELLRIPLRDGGRTGEVEADMVRSALLSSVQETERRITAQDGATAAWGPWQATLHQGEPPARRWP